VRLFQINLFRFLFMLIEVQFIKLGPLSPRQAEVAKFIVQGFVDKEIARALDISLKTVRIHVNAIYKKLGILNKPLNLRITASNMMVYGGMFSITSSFSF
jgi:DNA-binding NarL/FixJ family response regulator